MNPILRHKRWISASLVLILLFSLLASFPVFGGSLDSNNKFDINLSSYPNHNYYASKSSWKFQKIAGMGNENIAKYNILTEPVQAITVTEQGRTGLYIRFDDKGNKDNGWSLRLIDESKITAPPGVDATLDGEAGVPQATDLVKDMYHSYWWILNNNVWDPTTNEVNKNYKQFVKLVPEPVSGGRKVEIPYISYDFLKGITAFINKETTNGYFYWQGKYTNGPDTYEVIYRGKSSTKQNATNYGVTNFYLNANTGFKPSGSPGAGIEKGTVQLEFMAEVQYDKVHVLLKNATYWFNHYTNVGISEYSVAASKTMLSGDKKKSDSVVGNLDILEQNDTLTIRLFSSINSITGMYFPDMDYYNSHKSEFTVERRNPAVFTATEVPYMVFVASYMPMGSSTINAIVINDVIMQQPGKIIPTSAVSATPFINVNMPKDAQYILIVPILNPYRFYEDIREEFKKYGTETLKNAFIQKLKGGEDSGTLKIIQQMKNDYADKGMGFAFNENLTANDLAEYLADDIIKKIEADYKEKKDKNQLDSWHTQNVGDGRAKILYGDRLFPTNTTAQVNIINETRKAIEDVINRKKNPITVFRDAEQKVKAYYDQNTTIQDIVKAYLGDNTQQGLGWRNILVLPYKIKQPDSITVKITDTGISPKVENALEGAGKSEYESKAITDPSYAIPGKIYTARYSITNNSDQPITSLALRYYVVSTKPDGVGHPKIFESKPIGVFYGTEYTFNNYDGKPKTVNSYVPYYAGTNNNGENFETLHSKIGDPYMKLKEENDGTWPEWKGAFIDPGETVEGTFLWKMPDATQNPSKDPVVLYVTAALKLDKNANMKGTGSSEINSHFDVEELNYYPDQDPAMFFSFTPNQIMARHVENTNVNNLRDSRTIAARLDSYVPNPKDPFDPIAYPPDKLQDKQTFLRYTTTENISYQEYDEWVEDGYWIERQPLIVRYKRTQWIVR